MIALMIAYAKLKNGDSLGKNEILDLKRENINSFQWSSLAVQLALKDQNRLERELLVSIIKDLPELECYIHILKENTCPTPTPNAKPEYLYILNNTAKNKVIGQDHIKYLITNFVGEEISLNFMAVWLMTVCYRGLSQEDLHHLTNEMIQSGDVIDYRNQEELKNKKIVRRYPTGAVSEKVALILPALISSVRNEFPVISPFLVARSLGFTGGTWDKLKAIPGFTFPESGPEAMKALKQCGIAMSVTKEKLCPADRKMYQFRSMTGTIESPELIIASIASKQLALPADHLLMDVRYGEGAFLPTYIEAEKLAASLSSFINEGGVPCSYHLTNSSEPNGMAIGNAYEVLEAIAVMNRDFENDWDIRAIEEQKDLVLTFFEILMSNAFPEENIDWKQLASHQFDEGKVFQSFLNILESHQVSKDVLYKLQTTPQDVLGINAKKIIIQSRVTGIFKKIDQKKLGGLINFELGGGGNDYAGTFTPDAGLILRKRIGDQVNYEDMLCSLFVPMKCDWDLQSIINKIYSCFIFDENSNREP